MWSKGAFEVDMVLVEYHVKHFEEGSKFGIDKGRISKLDIIADSEILACYDRNWIIEPRTDIARKALQKILAEYN